VAEMSPFILSIKSRNIDDKNVTAFSKEGYMTVIYYLQIAIQ